MTRNFSKKLELIILSEHFAPSTSATAQLVSDLADDLHRMGVRLQIITSTAGSTDQLFPIHRFSRTNGSNVGIAKKLINGLIFFGGSVLWLLTNIKPNNSLLIVSNPPFIGLIGLLLLIIKKTPYIFLFQDVFPRSASLTGILPAHGPLTFFWRSVLRAVLSRSRSNIILSPAMARRCQLDFGSKISFDYIPNWAVIPPHSQSKKESHLAAIWGLQNIFTIQYSGNFGRLHEILTILEAARLLKDEPIKFLFVGDGAKAPLILRYCQTYNLNNVVIKSYQPRALLADSYAACDASIVSLVPGAEDTVAPSKLYGILASSKAILLISGKDTDLADLVTRSQCGVVISQGDVAELCEGIVQLKNNPELVSRMGKNALCLYLESYGRLRSTYKYYCLLKGHGMV